MIEFTRHADGTVTGKVLEPDEEVAVHFVADDVLVGHTGRELRRHLIALDMVEIGPHPDRSGVTMFVHRPGRQD